MAKKTKQPTGYNRGAEDFFKGVKDAHKSASPEEKVDIEALLAAAGMKRQVSVEQQTNPSHAVRIKGARENGGDIYTFVKNGEKAPELYTQEEMEAVVKALQTTGQTVKKEQKKNWASKLKEKGKAALAIVGIAALLLGGAALVKDCAQNDKAVEDNQTRVEATINPEDTTQNEDVLGDLGVVEENKEEQTQQEESKEETGGNEQDSEEEKIKAEQEAAKLQSEIQYKIKSIELYYNRLNSRCNAYEKNSGINMDVADKNYQGTLEDTINDIIKDYGEDGENCINSILSKQSYRSEPGAAYNRYSDYEEYKEVETKVYNDNKALLEEKDSVIKSNTIEDENGEKLSDTEYLEKLTEYYNKLYDQYRYTPNIGQYSTILGDIQRELARTNAEVARETTNEVKQEKEDVETKEKAADEKQQDDAQKKKDKNDDEMEMG